MEENTELRNLKTTDGFGWFDCVFVEICPDTRLYWKVTEYKLEFACIHYTGSEVYPKKVEPWDPESRGEVWFDGYGFRFGDSGVRHLYFKGNKDGYFYYPNLEDLSKALNALKELEDKFTDR